MHFPASQAKKDAAKAKRKQRKLANGQRMSTAIDLVEPEAHPSDRLKTPQGGSSAQRDPLSGAMAPFPLPMQQYMRDQGFPEPMPIQEMYPPPLHRLLTRLDTVRVSRMYIEKQGGGGRGWGGGGEAVRPDGTLPDTRAVHAGPRLLNTPASQKNLDPLPPPFHPHTQTHTPDAL